MSVSQLQLLSDLYVRNMIEVELSLFKQVFKGTVRGRRGI